MVMCGNKRGRGLPVDKGGPPLAPSLNSPREPLAEFQAPVLVVASMLKSFLEKQGGDGHGEQEYDGGEEVWQGEGIFLPEGMATE